MLITAVEPRKKMFSAVYIDGEFAFKLDTQVLIENHIRAGVEIDDEQLKEIVDLSDNRRAKNKALNLLAYKDRTKKELIDRISEQYSKESAVIATNRMEELGLVDDEKYARKMAQQLLEKKCMPKRAVKYKLIEKGIDRELIEDILCELEIEPKEQIQKLLETKYRNKLYDEQSRKKTTQALQRMGYSWYDIKPIIDEYIEDDEEYMY